MVEGIPSQAFLVEGIPSRAFLVAGIPSQAFLVVSIPSLAFLVVSIPFLAFWVVGIPSLDPSWLELNIVCLEEIYGFPLHDDYLGELPAVEGFQKEKDHLLVEDSRVLEDSAFLEGNINPKLNLMSVLKNNKLDYFSCK